MMFCIDCLIGERVQDITFWKTELNNEIRAMENETDNLKVQFTQIELLKIILCLAQSSTKRL